MPSNRKSRRPAVVSLEDVDDRVESRDSDKWPDDVEGSETGPAVIPPWSGPVPKAYYAAMMVKVGEVIDGLASIDSIGQLDPEYGEAAQRNALRLYQQLYGCSVAE